MARKITQYNGQVNPVDTSYPDGDIKDDDGSDNGTIIDRKSNADIQQFFMKIMRVANITPNGFPDNEYTGFQLFEALKRSALGYKKYSGIISQSSTGNPTGIIYDVNTIGTLVWARDGVGDYSGTLASAFPIQTTQLFISGSDLGFVKIRRASSGTIRISTTDLSGSPSDDILLNTAFEIRVNLLVDNSF